MATSGQVIIQEARRNKNNPCGLGMEGPQECSPEKKRKGPFLPGPFVLAKAEVFRVIRQKLFRTWD